MRPIISAYSHMISFYSKKTSSAFALHSVSFDVSFCERDV